LELTQTHQAQRLEPRATLDEIHDLVRSDRDDYADHRGIVLHETEMSREGTWRYNGEAGSLTRHSLGQLCSRLRLPDGNTVPAGYFARCPNELAVDHLNHWLSVSKERPQTLLVRTKEGGPFPPTVRAVLSERYAAVDHLDLLEKLRELLVGQDLYIHAWSIDDEQLTLRLLMGSDHPASLDDPIRIGLHISNSEVGLGSITVSALITRLVCMNGMVVQIKDLGSLRRRHIGKAGDSLRMVIQEGLTRILHEADQAAVWFLKLRETSVQEPVDALIRTMVEDRGLPETLVPLVQDTLEGETMYDVVNGFTQAAQRFPIAERLEIETAMSRYLQPN
jgi:hypothetical protein